MTTATTTKLTTTDGLRVYDLAPHAAELVAVAGPDGYEPSEIDQDSLPTGFRWVNAAEWESLQQDLTPADTADLLNSDIDLAELRGEYLGSYGRYGGTLVHEVYAVPLYADEIRRLWDRLDSVECVTEEDRIFARLKQLGALVSE